MSRGNFANQFVQQLHHSNQNQFGIPPPSLPNNNNETKSAGSEEPSRRARYQQQPKRRMLKFSGSLPPTPESKTSTPHNRSTFVASSSLRSNFDASEQQQAREDQQISATRSLSNKTKSITRNRGLPTNAEKMRERKGTSKNVEDTSRVKKTGEVSKVKKKKKSASKATRDFTSATISEGNNMEVADHLSRKHRNVEKNKPKGQLKKKSIFGGGGSGGGFFSKMKGAVFGKKSNPRENASSIPKINNEKSIDLMILDAMSNFQTIVDKDSGKTFYYNVKTNKSQWNHPLLIQGCTTNHGIICSAPYSIPDQDEFVVDCYTMENTNDGKKINSMTCVLHEKVLMSELKIIKLVENNNKLTSMRSKVGHGWGEMINSNDNNGEEVKTDAIIDVINCPDKHGLTLTIQRKLTVKISCDICWETIFIENKVHSCRKCDYDVCTNCFASKKQELEEKVSNEKRNDGEIKTSNAEKNVVHITEIFRRCFSIYGSRPCLGYEHMSSPQHWKWLTYNAVNDLMKGIYSVLLSNTILPGSFIGMSADNSMAYIIVYFSLMMHGYICVPLSMHLSNEHASNIIQEAKLKAIFVDENTTKLTYETIIKDSLKSSGGANKGVSGKKSLRTASSTVVQPLLLSCMHFNDPDNFNNWIKTNTNTNGNPNPNTNITERDIEDPMLVLYTSGSTGAPKGAIMSERSFLMEARGMMRLDHYQDSDVSVCDAPMAVSATPYNLASSFMNGGRVAVYRDLVRVFEICKIISPSSIGLVPQMWAVLYKRYMSEVELLKSSTTNMFVIDEEIKKIEKKYREIELGWRVRNLNCGGATPMKIVQKWLKNIYAKGTNGRCSVSENYASTEAGPITSSWGDGGDTDGVVMDYVQIKFVDWGEYKSTDTPFPRGEILVKSNAMSSGYLNRPDLTQDAYDADGFYHTGDIGELIDKGPPKRIKVVDRCKNIFKLLNGEWVSPENVEATFTAECSLIDQILIHGDSRHTHVVAIVVVAANSDDTVTTTQVMNELKSVGIEHHEILRHFEIPSEIFVVKDRFTPENGQMTQTNKLCRPQIRKKYSKEIEFMFDQTEIKQMQKEEKSQLSIVSILRKYIGKRGLIKTKENLIVDSKDLKMWNKLDWSSQPSQYAHDTIKQHFKIELGASTIWNRGHGQTIPDLVDLLYQSISGNVVVTNNYNLNWENEIDVSTFVSELKMEQNKITEVDNSAVSVSTKDVVFITGCTGFLGACFLVQLVRSLNLCKTSNLEICCLVRTSKGQTPNERLINSLENREQIMDKVVQLINENIVYGVSGDLGLLQLGMSTDVFLDLSNRVQHIIHCGSYVNHMFDYDALKSPNCDSIYELTKMAYKNKPSILYISTISVLENDETEDCEGIRDFIENSAGGYGQSKYVAEQRLRKLLPYYSNITIVRPGLIGFDTRNGSANRSDWFVRLLIGSMQMGGVVCVDDDGVSVEGTINVTPVDHASLFLMEVLAKRTSLLNGDCEDKEKNNIETLHIPLTVSMDTSEFLQTYARVASDSSGRLMKYFSLEDWYNHLLEIPRDNAVYPFRQQFYHGFQGIPGHSFNATISKYSKTVNDNSSSIYNDEMMEHFVEYLMRREPSVQKKIMLRTLSCGNNDDQKKELRVPSSSRRK